jgi:hypothetical protein
MSILETVQRHRAEQRRIQGKTAIGADLIPRAPHDDSRYADIDLLARGQDIDALLTGIARLDLGFDDLSADLRATVERIARELREAGPEEIGRWATDVLFAYADVSQITSTIEVAMYHAWALSLFTSLEGRLPAHPSGIASRFLSEAD